MVRWAPKSYMHQVLCVKTTVNHMKWNQTPLLTATAVQQHCIVFAKLYRSIFSIVVVVALICSRSSYNNQCFHMIWFHPKHTSLYVIIEATNTVMEWKPKRIAKD